MISAADRYWKTRFQEQVACLLVTRSTVPSSYYRPANATRRSPLIQSFGQVPFGDFLMRMYTKGSRPALMFCNAWSWP